ncbi:uracil-DNA glycosylase [Stereum hirsutum FP-91666 SS1]|uniref:uracil-DNA glycosylase n=1 Tax=Stereum hirsutum (strain FP-91666) TaxID=721885 RepID=UPI000440B4DE|nr:uracil-DNA glycosylase [Stereum hirsutum FP-91666 SS1]EIM90965.1 uracil-DNA glycosylase [Stereum hirsutum FP-91666 SS1]
MFSVAPKDGAGPASKKLKASPSLSSVSGSLVPGPSKGTSSSSTKIGFVPLNSIPFSLSAYLESLTEDQRRLLQLECETLGKSWLKLLKDEIKKPYFIALKEWLWEQGLKGPNDTPMPLKIYPAPKDIYSWSNFTPLGRVKVVIIGQDPYHGARQAHGLSFSVPTGVAVPPSLRNIYAEIKAEFPEFVAPNHGNLTAWAENGVLMLNTCLTVRAGEAGSHSKRGWEEFTDKVVDVVDRRGRGCVFLCWGAWAAKRVAKLDGNKHLILTSAHPSPFSAHKGFLGNGHFAKANEWLENRYGKESKVDWCTL